MSREMSCFGSTQLRRRSNLGPARGIHISERFDAKIHRPIPAADFQRAAVLFHVTTAYDILRDCGVDLVKRDFLGKPDQ
jgi:hypothetical protein